MLLYKLKRAIVILIFLLTGCIEKDELTRPVRIQLKIGIAPPDDSPGDRYFYFNWGHIGVYGIQVEGKREVGEDILFETDPITNLPPVEFNLHPEIISEFDIPQGIYTFMRWNFTLKSIETLGLFGTDLQNTGFVIWAIYEYSNESSISIYFCIDKTELLRFSTFDPDGSTRIVLSEYKIHEVNLLLDANYAFQTISRTSIENAVISNDLQGKPVILISRYNNKDLYEHILNRISQSARVVVF